MFIPVWSLHVVATLLLFLGLWWAQRTEGDYDLSILFKLPTVLLGYAVYWIIFLGIKGCAH